LRRAAKLAASIPETQSSVGTALKEFDAALPHLKRMRDIAEHIDEYAVDQGRQRSVVRQSLEVSSMSDHGSTLEWLGGRLNSHEALQASQRLFEVIKEASRAFPPRA
jgi:hypothetical protein